MTYRELKEKLEKLSEEHLDQDVSILDMDRQEVFPAFDFVCDWKANHEDYHKMLRDGKEDYYAQGIDQVDGVLDDGHPYLTICK